jgi:hypothetical protein
LGVEAAIYDVDELWFGFGIIIKILAINMERNGQGAHLESTSR